jgi:pyruvate,water dikinase
MGGDGWRAARGWRRDAIHYAARPLHPLDVSFVVDTVGPGSEIGFEEWALPMARIADKTVNGWVYTRMEPAGDPPELLVRLMGRVPFLTRLWRVIPPLRQRVLAFDDFLAAGGFEAHIGTWEDVWRPEAERRHADLRRVRLETAGRVEVAAHLEGWRDYLVWQWSPHVRIHLVCFIARGKFARLCRRLFGLDDHEAYELIKRTDPVLLEAPRKLADIARRAAGDADVTAVLRRSGAEALDALRDTWFEDVVAAFMDAHGDVPVDGFEAALPTWRELPERVVGVVRQMIAADYDPDGEDAAVQARRKTRIDELRSRVSGEDLAEFDRLLALGERAYPLNDTHNYLLFDLPLGLIRYTALRAGELLVSDGLLDDVSDVFFLYLPELTELLRRGGDARALVVQRREELARAAALDPPEIVGTQPVPSTEPFPPRVAEALGILLEQSNKMYGSATAVASATLSGIAGSPGSAEGRVCVVRNVGDLEKVTEGDVLVCPMTGPAWTVVFPIISALVTEAGGSMSHPAIVAREFGIPSVVGTGNATRVLRDGQRVRVDGAEALVEVIGAG